MMFKEKYYKDWRMPDEVRRGYYRKLERFWEVK